MLTSSSLVEWKHAFLLHGIYLFIKINAKTWFHRHTSTSGKPYSRCILQHCRSEISETVDNLYHAVCINTGLIYIEPLSHPRGVMPSVLLWTLQTLCTRKRLTSATQFNFHPRMNTLFSWLRLNEALVCGTSAVLWLNCLFIDTGRDPRPPLSPRLSLLFRVRDLLVPRP